MNICFVLVEPETPENVGAAARAIKTMGFQELRIIGQPGVKDSPEARKMAHRSQDILEKSNIYDRLEMAVSDIDFVVGTTSCYHKIYKNFHNLKDLPNILKNRPDFPEKIAVVFGRESNGLNNRELQQCDIVTCIPMIAPHPSINLAQAVMIYAYVLSTLPISANLCQATVKTLADQEKYKNIKAKIAEVLCKVDIDQNNRTHNKILDIVSTLCVEDLNLLHYLCNKTNSALNLDGANDHRVQGHPKEDLEPHWNQISK